MEKNENPVDDRKNDGKDGVNIRDDGRDEEKNTGLPVDDDEKDDGKDDDKNGKQMENDDQKKKDNTRWSARK